MKVSYGYEVKDNHDPFITLADRATEQFSLATAGPWKYARYPNYGGEILQWWGLWLLSIAVLSGGYWVCIISPLFLMCLLLFVSGVPLQEKQARPDPLL